VGDATAQSDTFANILSRVGAKSAGASSYLGIAFLIVMVLTGLAVAGLVGSARDEEAQGYLDNLLARPMGRAQWVAGRVGMTVAVVMLMAVAAGTTTWLAAASQHTGVPFSRLF